MLRIPVAFFNVPRSLSLALLAGGALLMAGCNPGIKLVGKWELDSEKMRAKAEQEAGGNPLATLAAGMLSVVETEVEFKADGTFKGSASALGQLQTVTGTWRYSKTDGDDMVIAIKGERDAAEREVRVRFVDWDNIETEAPTGTQGVTGSGTFPFKRKKQE
jgi:hypothetical protein